MKTIDYDAIDQAVATQCFYCQQPFSLEDPAFPGYRPTDLVAGEIHPRCMAPAHAALVEAFGEEVPVPNRRELTPNTPGSELTPNSVQIVIS